jgi:hypothetical protein
MELQLEDLTSYLYSHHVYTISASRVAPDPFFNAKYRGKLLTYFIPNEPGLELTPL